MNQLLHKDDVEILDKIISECLKNGIAIAGFILAVLALFISIKHK